MKSKLALSTATALGLLMGGALAGDNNKTVSVQDGNDNKLRVEQDGSNNVAGNRTTHYNEYLKQAGDNNLMDIQQTGNSNQVARNGPGNSGAFQTGNLNKLTLTQTSFGYNQHGNGHQIDRIRQNSSDSATGNAGDTNVATITQKGTTATIIGQGPSAGHYIGVITQTHSTGAANSLEIEQAGAYSAHYGGGQNNRIGTVTQNGSDNSATLKQDGTGPVQTTSGQQQRGPSNVINTVDQQGSGHDARVTQNGFQNYVAKVEQSSSDNSALISLTGSGNGATRGSGHPGVGALVNGASAAGAAASSVVQKGGSNNQVEYTVFNGDDNQFGFYQDGAGNLAVDIRITGDGNNLGVHQTGTDNWLELATIDGSDNVIGLKQDGIGNAAVVTVTGDRNVGNHSFGNSDFVAPLVLAHGLTAGLLEQYGNGNEVSLVVDGTDNKFASLQGDRSTKGNNNKITAKQDGTWHQAAVVQIGNSNVASMDQSGSGNSVSISQ